MSHSNKTQTGLRPTPTVEDYLAVMYVMERDGEEIIAARLAESLEVAPPTVTVTLKRMERDGWLINEGRKGIHLTDSGCAAACAVVRRHMLTEWMLARMLHVPWSQIHSEAHHLEHSISAEIEAHLRDNLDDPQTCPHGNPLPGFEHVTAAWTPLTRFEQGQRITVRRIHESAEDNQELMSYLENNGIIPGVQVEVSQVLLFNQTITLKVGEKEVILGATTAQYIFGEIG